MLIFQPHPKIAQTSLCAYKIQPYTAQKNFNSQFKSDRINFTSKDLLTENTDNIFIEVKKAIQPKNLIGEGGEACVYKIPDSTYCVRVDYQVDDTHLDKYRKSFNSKVSIQDKINHVEAKFGNNITIMQIIKGSPVYTPFMPPQKAKQIAQQIADMPTNSFHTLLKQISTAYDNGMLFDCAWGNIIVTPETQKLTAIDFNKSNEPLKLLCYTNEALVHEHTTIAQQKTYAGKIITSVIKELSPNNKPFYNLNNLDFYMYIHKLKDKGIIENPKYADVFCKLFDELKELKFSEFRGNLQTPLLEHNIKIANILIKQLFNVI